MSSLIRTIMLVMVLSLFSTNVFAVSPTPFTIIKNPINFSIYKGKWVVIAYWATWCNVCMGEIPMLNAFYRAHNDKVFVFGVNYDDGSLKDLPRRVDESGIAFPVFAYDPKGRFGVSRIRGLPTLLLIGPDGKLKHVLTGSTSRRALENMMRL